MRQEATPVAMQSGELMDSRLFVLLPEFRGRFEARYGDRPAHRLLLGSGQRLCQRVMKALGVSTSMPGPAAPA